MIGQTFTEQMPPRLSNHMFSALLKEIRECNESEPSTNYFRDLEFSAIMLVQNKFLSYIWQAKVKKKKALDTKITQAVQYQEGKLN